MMAKGNLFEEALAAEGVSGNLAELARSIYMQESGGGKNTKTSNAGAVGGMQIIPSTFNRMADKDWNIHDPFDNARAGIRYLKLLDTKSGGVPELTAAGYYGGEGAIAKARKGIAVSDPRNPNAPNTLEYGKQVAARIQGNGVQTPKTTPEKEKDEALAALESVMFSGDFAGAAPIQLEASKPYKLSKVDEWDALKQAMPEARDIAAMSAYGQPDAASYASLLGSLTGMASEVKPDFSPFTGRKARG